jgi:hypothetical protein
LFNVKIENTAGEKFTILIKDDMGTTLYRGTFSDKEFNKKFQLPKTDHNRFVFTVKSDSGNKTESFEVNSSTRVVEDVVVKKV